MSPYRIPAEPDRARATGDEEERCPDGDLLPVFLVLWLGSIVRVVIALMRHEHFGTETSLAVLAVAYVPFLTRDGLRWAMRRWLGRR